MLHIRLHSHLLTENRFATVEEVVKHYGCIQAQDIPQAKWVLGSRIQGSTEQDVIDAINERKIVRSWPMRGTLHYMNPENLSRMLDVCASKTLKGFARRREYLEITDAHAEKALQLMSVALRGGKLLTRTQMGLMLADGGIPMQPRRVYHLCCYAATRKVICFGPPADKEETFVLLDEWITNHATLTRDEQLARLATMYIRSHGPVGVEGLARWTGLGKTVCKEAIGLVAEQFESVEKDGKIYRYSPSCVSRDEDRSVVLLAGFDEYFLGYKDRSIVADPEYTRTFFTKTGIFFPLIMQGGKIVGRRKRTWKKKATHIEYMILPGEHVEEKKIVSEAKRFTDFWNKPESSIKKVDGF